MFAYSSVCPQECWSATESVKQSDFLPQSRNTALVLELVTLFSISQAYCILPPSPPVQLAILHIDQEPDGFMQQ